MVGRGDHHGVHVFEGHQIAIRGELSGLAPIPFFRLGGCFFLAEPPRIAYGGNLEVLGVLVCMHAGHVRSDTPAAAADQTDRDPVVGAEDA
jgi:hypothetical protein